MKELVEIVRAWDLAHTAGLDTALATVVHVVGSAYRHEGARMLVTETGELTGAISGGCLEGDALRKARQAMLTKQNMLVTYDTTDEDDATLGIGLGCNGVIHILFEPVDPANENNPISLLRSFLKKRQSAVLGTFFSLKNRSGIQPGTCMLLTDEENVGALSPDLHLQFLTDAEKVLRSGTSLITEYDTGLTAFVEYLQPSPNLLIFGAGNDAIPLAQFASVLGWETAVIDGRANYAKAARFPGAKQILVSKAHEAFQHLNVDQRTVAVLMTHNYNYDLEVLKQAVKFDINYIGALGPKKKLARMLDELTEQGISISSEQRNKIFGPTGLDIGSVTPEEIALSIVSEIQAVLSGRNGMSLRYREVANPDLTPSRKHANGKFNSCVVGL